MAHIFLEKSFAWLEHPSGENVLASDIYCATRDVFQGRLDNLRRMLEEKMPDDSALFIAVCGEIGNNSFDHNIGNWRDIPGVYFEFDTENFSVILADRGRGVRATLGRVMPGLQNDREAVEAAFTRRISGRLPEQRGNGLKFVRDITEGKRWSLEFFSGLGVASIVKGGKIEFLMGDNDIKGCVALVSMK